MFKKRYLVLLLFLIICIGAISAVSAADLNATDDVSSIEDSDKIAVSNDDVLSADPGTYTDLQHQIESHIDYGEVTLYRDYSYVESVDDESGTGNNIYIEDDISIYGNNHYIFCNDAYPFWIDEDCSVDILDVIFYGEYASKPATEVGGAIINHGELLLRNCIFINCQADNEGGAIYNIGTLRLENCVFIGNSVTNSTGVGGAISNYDELFITDSSFQNNSAYKGGAVYTKGDSWIQNSLFGTYLEENITGPNEAKYGTSIYNEPGKICDINQCVFNDTDGKRNAEVISNVIASTCYFDKYSNVAGGVIYNCTTQQKSFSNTINSTGFSFETPASLTTKFKSGKNLEVTVTSNPTGERVSNVCLEVIIDWDYSNPRYITTNSNGVASFYASGLAPGNHKILIRLSNDIFGKQQKTIPVTIQKSKVILKTSKVVTTYKSGKKMTITVTDASSKKPVANANVKLKVYTGSSFKTYTVKTNSKGQASFSASTINKGYHKVVISISQTGYYGSSISSSIKINPATLKYKVIRQNRGFGSGVSVYVKLASTNKYTNGIKLNLKVYSGSSYKSYTLVTGFDDDEWEDGCIGYASNKISVGTHKIVITPVGSNFKGSVSTSITIKSSVKNYQKFTAVFTNGETVYK